ncbi:uncharacterized protein CG5098 isoform X2 [Leptidea sinapis]|uniref:uncharacterized protein CG5098 isoform X2 n=1 Tax=Leptidea sinapis TaxID=189913 RepID=UPI0021C2FFD6|nr:uncharacterized protein CG5098 isoform X2 [Leptidea sinapis]
MMSGGSQHNPNGRQAQLGAGWSPLQVANLLARAPQAHMASDRGVTWHTPTPPPHLYHVPAPSPPDPLQAMKSATGNSVFRHTATPPEMYRHTATPPELYRHTPTPPDKHHMRHTPSPGDVKAGTVMQPTELYPHLGPSRDKLVRAEELLAYARGGVDLTVGSRNGSPHTPALSVRDAPTINSLIARHARPPHARVDALLERLSTAPVSPHSVIVHSRAAPTPSPPSSNEDSTDSCGAPPGSKRKRKPERTLRVPVPPPLGSVKCAPAEMTDAATPQSFPQDNPALENGDVHQNGPERTEKLDPAPEPHTRRKSRSGSAETIDDIAAMIANTEHTMPPEPLHIEPETPVTIDKLKSVLASPEPEKSPQSSPKPISSPPKTPVISPTKSPHTSPPKSPVKEELEEPASAAAPRRRNSESSNVPVESPSEAKPAESSETKTAEPTSASFVEVENQLEKMFAGIEEPPSTVENAPKNRKRRKSAPTKGEKASKRTNRRSTGDEAPRRKPPKKKGRKDGVAKDAYDSGSNASSSRSRGPYIQIVGRRDSPVSVAVVNATTEEERRTDEWRNSLKARGLHASTLGLRYDASTPDVSWLCAFCERGPHYNGLGDLFGPYTVDFNCEEYRSLDEASRQRFPSTDGGAEVWFHEACAVWAPGLVAAGSRLWGLASAVWSSRASKCAHCSTAGAPIACATRTCRARAHLPCATSNKWNLDDENFKAICPRHV